MKKKEIIEAVQAKLGCETTAEAAKALEAVTGVFSEAINAGAAEIKLPLKGEPSVKPSAVLSLPGFGTFKVGANAEREARSPQSGETVIVSPKRRVSFKAAPNLGQ